MVLEDRTKGTETLRIPNIHLRCILHETMITVTNSQEVEAVVVPTKVGQVNETIIQD